MEGLIKKGVGSISISAREMGSGGGLLLQGPKQALGRLPNPPAPGLAPRPNLEELGSRSGARRRLRAWVLCPACLASSQSPALRGKV